MMTMSSWRQLCSAELLHYAWPNFLLLNSRNALVSSTETSEISIWGEVPLPTSLMKGVINPHPFFCGSFQTDPQKGLLCRRPGSQLSPVFLAELSSMSSAGQLPKPRLRSAVCHNPSKRKNKNQVLTGFSPWLTWNELTALMSQRGFKLFRDACIKNSVMY